MKGPNRVGLFHLLKEMEPIFLKVMDLKSGMVNKIQT